MSELSFHQRIVKVQSEVKVLKENRNDFGRYNYRSCEDILHTVKPILAKYDLTIMLSDSIVLIGERYYINSVATVSDGLLYFSNSAMAREADKQAGMSDAQLTGSSSSYARKYALSGLLGLDDEKDPDTRDNTLVPEKAANRQYPAQKPANAPIAAPSPIAASDAQKNALKRMGIAFQANISKSEASKLIEQANKR